MDQGLFSVAAPSEWGQAGGLISQLNLWSSAQTASLLECPAYCLLLCISCATQDPATQLDPETSSQGMAEEDRVLPTGSIDLLVAKWDLERAIWNDVKPLCGYIGLHDQGYQLFGI